ncbi:MAG: glycosyl transferase [Propionibacteriales bacterium]|nr:MAG: glycosyl transferase [Propionibacteriales bacterium]
MIRLLKITAVLLLVSTLASLGYGVLGYLDAIRNSDDYASRADALIAEGRGPNGLGADRLRQLLLVQDPGFLEHGGVDLSTNGAGATTISQSVSKRLGFAEFEPGIGKIRQTGFALGLESRLTKDQILTLFLDTVKMGHGPDGMMTGFFHASESVYGRSPAQLSEREYVRLLAVLIAPGEFRLLEDDVALADRSARIEKLISGSCKPLDHGDVWLEGCA